MNVSLKTLFCVILFFSVSHFLTAQNYMEFCETVQIEINDSCSTQFTFENRVLPDDGASTDSFNIHVYVDLWHDGILDYDFISDASQQTFGQAILHSKVASFDQIELFLPQVIDHGCNDHRVYWNLYSDSGDTTSCVQDYQTRLNFNVVSGDTIEYIYNSGFSVNLNDLDFSNVQYAAAIEQCNYEPTYFFKDGGNMVSPTSGLYDYDCDFDLFRNVNYHTIYFEFGQNCEAGRDSLVLKIYNQLTDYFGSFIQGTCGTPLNNTVEGIEVETENCELEITQYLNSCNPLLIANLDDFYSEINTFNVSKEDITIRGLTTRDLLLMRKQILTGDSISNGIIFAGDINDNGDISTLDLVFLRKIILLLDPYDLPDPWLFELDYTSSANFYSTGIINEFEMNPEYISTTQLTDDFGFLAYKKGDLDGSYYRRFNNSTTIPCDYNTYDSIEVQLDTEFISDGDVFTIPIMLNEDLDLKGVHFGLSSNLVENISLTSGVLNFDSDQFNSLDTNFIASWMNDDLSSLSYSKGDVLFSLTMTATDDFDINELFQDTPDFPREVYINEDFETLTFKMGDVGLSNVNNPQLFDFTIHPNPFHRELFIKWGSESVKDIFIECIDVQGRRVMQQQFTEINMGQTIQLEIPHSLSESIYFLRITTNGQSTFRKLISIK